MKKYFHLMLTIGIMIMANLLVSYTVHNYSIIINFSLSCMMEFITNMYIIIDWISINFLTMVMMISTLIMMYSKEYMVHEKMMNKFMMIMMIFILSMVLMSLSSSLFWVMVGWDGLGLSSFCLIIYFQNWKSFNSAMTTFISNRIGDLFLISSIWLSMNFMSLSSWPELPLQENWYTVIMSIMISLTAFSKSAQIPFSSWLPLAMAAPTPVSSLVHSSTLITAGVYLLIRFSNFIQLNYFVTITSALTMMLASSSALWEYDLKKIIALSTLSHISLMMIFISMSCKEAAMIHLVMHACFKSSLFMTAGMIIHNNNNNQDIRSMFMPMKSNSKLWTILIISTMSMMGIPFLSGFYSKDIMLLSMSESSNSINTFMFFIILISIMLTAAYSSRIISYMVKTSPSMKMTNYENKLGPMMNAMIMGTILSSLLGSLMTWSFFPKELTMDMSMISTYIKSVLIFTLILGSLIGYSATMFKPSKNMLSLMFNNMWFINSFTMYSQTYTFNISQILMTKIDIKGWTDYVIEMIKYNLTNSTKLLMNSIFYNHFMKLIVIMMMIISIQMIDY